MGSPHPCRRIPAGSAIKGKMMAVIGMRRSSKTTFLWQCLADQIKVGTPRVNFQENSVEWVSVPGFKGHAALGNFR
jgi:hypothetical protein